MVDRMKAGAITGQLHQLGHLEDNQPIKTLDGSQASQAKNMWCKRQFVYIENCMGKSPIMKKMCN